MTKEDEITLLRNKIEEHLNWGPMQGWNNYDFEKLSVLIQEKTNIVLSLSTLRRFFNKVKSTYAPSVTTVNALAQWLGYEDFRDFQTQNSNENGSISQSIPSIAAESKRKGKISNQFLLWTGSGMGVLIVLLLLNTVFRTNRAKEDPQNFTFSANKIRTAGLPNSVIFNYKADKAKSDSIFIVQNWDLSKKVRVPKAGTHHSSIYYYPGFFRAKLIAGTQVVKTHDIHIVTDGWLALAERAEGTAPHYFNEKFSTQNGEVSIDKSILVQNNITDPFTTMRLYHHTALKPLFTDDFTFETSLKNNSPGTACPQVRIIIHAIDNAILFPLSNNYCVGDLSITALGKNIESKYEDLSKFGVELQNWNRVKVVGKDRLLYFYVNNILAYTLKHDLKPLQLVGLQVRFNGEIGVKDAEFSNKAHSIRLK